MYIICFFLIIIQELSCYYHPNLKEWNLCEERLSKLNKENLQIPSSQGETMNGNGLLVGMFMV